MTLLPKAFRLASVSSSTSRVILCRPQSRALADSINNDSGGQALSSQYMSPALERFRRKRASQATTTADNVDKTEMKHQPYRKDASYSSKSDFAPKSAHEAANTRIIDSSERKQETFAIAESSVSAADHDFARYERKKYKTRLPYTVDDASKLLMNWNFVGRSAFLRSLRDGLIQYGKLTDKQMEALRHFLMKPESNRYISPFLPYVAMDPIIMRLCKLTKKDFEVIKQMNSEFAASLERMQKTLAQRGTLTHKQVRYAGSMLYDIYGPESFNQCEDPAENE